MTVQQPTVSLRAPALDCPWSARAIFAASLRLGLEHWRCLVPFFALSVTASLVRSVLYLRGYAVLKAMVDPRITSLVDALPTLLHGLLQPWVAAWLLFWLVSVAVLFVSEPATLCAVLIQRETGRMPTVAESWGWAQQKMGVYTMATVLAGLAMVGGLLLALVPGVIAMTMLLLVQPIATFEAVTGMGACRASARHMTMARQWLALKCMLLWLLGFVPGYLVELVLGHANPLAMGLNVVVGSMLQGLMATLWLLLPLTFYLRLRQPKVGLSSPLRQPA